MNTNKIKQKYLNRIAVICGTYSLAGLLAICGVIHTTQSSHKDTKTARTASTIMYTLSIASISLVFMWIMMHIIKDANKFEIHAARNYIKSLIDNNPELKPYKSVMSNPNAMKQIATTISNHLDASEQQRILYLIENLNKCEKITTTDLDITYRNIRKIIENHIEHHKEFVPIIISMLGNPHYLVCTKQFTDELTSEYVKQRNAPQK